MYVARVLVVVPLLLSLSRQQDCGEFCCGKEDEGRVRLIGGRRPSEGYVELCLNGEWGTLCDENWDGRDASVLCHMLGYHRENALASKFSRFVEDRVALSDSGQKVHLDSIRCEGDETSIMECPHVTDEVCYKHLEDAGVVCEEDTCEDGDVRLVGGSDAKDGRVEICRDNVWGTVCSDTWNDNNNRVICKQLGLHDEAEYDIHLTMDYGLATTPLFLTDVHCGGGETNLSQCTSRDIINTTETCYPAGIMCDAPCNWNNWHHDPDGCSAIGDPGTERYNYDEFCFCSQYCSMYYRFDPDDSRNQSRGDCCRDILHFDNCIGEPRECEENAVRVVDGTQPWNGRLEICKGGVWGAVCEDNFEDIDASIACKQLDLSYNNSRAIPGGTYGGGRRMWINNVECTGNEDYLYQCQSTSPGYFRGCSPENATGIMCAGEEDVVRCNDGEVRLAGGINDKAGRVEVCLGDVWGSVCDNGFGEQEARVVCNQLGFTHSWSVVKIPLFESGVGPINLDDLECSGSEKSLFECAHLDPGVHNCYRSNEIAIACGAEPPQSCTDDEKEESMETLLKYGKVVPYQGLSGICNLTYSTNNDTIIFLPRRLNDLMAYTVSEKNLSDALMHQIGSAFELESLECQQMFSVVVCNSLFYSLNVSDGQRLPSPLCPEQCRVVEKQCPSLWTQYRKTELGKNADCDDLGRLLEPLPYCCHDGGIVTPTESPTTNGIATNQGKEGSNVAGVAAGVTIAILFLLVLSALGAGVAFLLIRKFRKLKQFVHGREEAVNALEMLTNLHNRESTRSLILNGKSNGASAAAMAGPGNHAQLRRKMSDDFIRYSRNSLTPYSAAPYIPTLSPISSRYLRQLTTDMLIPQSQLRLLDSIGTGEYGIVYKAHYVQGLKNGRTTEPKIVAVKTLKGYFDKEAIHVLLEESVKMKEFDHPNVLTLFGVCVDAGPAPYIVMPYMAKGSLLSYLRKERHNVIVDEKDDHEDVEDVRRKLLDIIHQISKGMMYLADRKFVHRDLATRNCMMDVHNVIKVSDFGLSEDMYAKNYFRQDKDAAVKLPIKWMAPESLNDGLFTEKTDVWSYGVTCWEVFSGGKTPYPGINPISLVRILEDGERLEKPQNAACPNFAYELMCKCWNLDPKKRPAFIDIETEVDHIMEVTAGYLALSVCAPPREGETMTDDRSDTDSPELVRKLIKGVKTGVGITIQLDACENSGDDRSSGDTNETST